MKIRELYIKNFGKFSDKRILLEDGINLFYGENESGKSTTHTFIKSMLFGLERGRGRASVNDTFSLYEPWENPNYYAGTLRFESGGKHFCLQRNFDKYSKDASLICEDDGEEFSIEHGDLEMILGGLTASNYDNTVAIAQMQVETNQNLAIELQNYATNYYSAGNGDIHLDSALNMLAKRRKELEKELRDELQKKQQKKTELEQEASYVWRDIHKFEQELEQVEPQSETVEEKKGLHPIWIVIMLLLLVASFFLLHKPWKYLLTIVLALGEMMILRNRMKSRNLPEEDSKALWQKEQLEALLKEKQVEYGNLQEALEELIETDEVYLQKEKKRRAIELATERLSELSKEVHGQLGAELNRRVSEILSAITGGKYTTLFIDEKLKMHLFAGDRKIDILQVSRGTIEQIYFALRMAASELLHEEEYPVILDDTFVFYDEIRLENTLRWLAQNKKQVLLFTCQKREGELLQKLKGESVNAIL